MADQRGERRDRTPDVELGGVEHDLERRTLDEARGDGREALGGDPRVPLRVGVDGGPGELDERRAVAIERRSEPAPDDRVPSAEDPEVEEYLEPFALSRQPSDVPANRGHKVLARIDRIADRRGPVDGIRYANEHPVEQLDEQLVDGGEVEEDEPAAHPCFGGDGARGDRWETAASGDGEGSAEDLLAAPLLGRLTAGHRGRDRGEGKATTEY